MVDFQLCQLSKICSAIKRDNLCGEMKQPRKNQMRDDINYQIAGWILFIICAILFLASSLKSHDTLAFIGSLAFLIACIVFLIPIFRTFKNSEDDSKSHDRK
jgi:predicted membrane channel-forming protein YqfA (hemolysin III family)